MKANRKGIHQIYRTFNPEEMKVDLEFIRETTNALLVFDETLSEKLYDPAP